MYVDGCRVLVVFVAGCWRLFYRHVQNFFQTLYGFVLDFCPNFSPLHLLFEIRQPLRAVERVRVV